ncbi:hypothetical protein E4U42_005363 [Claviceps africana]|uniref:Uncharacterized protein n=1 Tax=Claviceps africana TaxID=83212 RepID=A0A8K0J4U2_9HYPO|nr:hypothetical protein E4U42_005363 [Claviceps africana]
MHLSPSAALAALALYAGQAAAAGLNYDSLGIKPCSLSNQPISLDDFHECAPGKPGVWNCPVGGVSIQTSPYGLEVKPPTRPVELYVVCDNSYPFDYTCPAGNRVFIGRLPEKCTGDALAIRVKLL